MPSSGPVASTSFLEVAVSSLRTASSPTAARTSTVCSPSRGARSGSRAGVRVSFGTAAGATNSCPDADWSGKSDLRARTWGSAMISSTERTRISARPPPDTHMPGGSGGDAF